MNVPDDRRYTTDHEWAKADDGYGAAAANDATNERPERRRQQHLIAR